jgi:hypothetical protein
MLAAPMTTEVRELIDEMIELTGADAPGMLDAEAPVLVTDAPQRSIYLVGLVGGKDVGKSSLVNALVGKPITLPTSHGRGTETVVAYAHESAAGELRELLEREVPGRFTIVTHSIQELSRRVLLDLPDIDSRYDDHLQRSPAECSDTCSIRFGFRASRNTPTSGLASFWRPWPRGTIRPTSSSA